ncbi:uncharacterized protein LOC118496112 [Xyrichtys novacula]|uniref:Uncharacterized protein LOC118496112 n=1 Tax=Xyrichtys novacula TaxID=13765 RepID=A0AAV1FPM5_XYRNO|nr:uncharacterized protein LOC118496112 [Xyrichtys novacula]
MTQRIIDLRKSCGLYDALSNNCEHLATFVRYGVKVALQIGMTAEGICIDEWRMKRKHMLEFVKNSLQGNNAPAAGPSGG